ncbi:Helix-turn-helix domain-containing protein OS=Streptomyces tendae OX=1932 GN=GUR47_14715 PE=4 SV=1 [Streptomyces tendae]
MRGVTVHHAAELARQYPRAQVAPDVLYVDEDPVITSAGTAAGIDACLHIGARSRGRRRLTGSPGAWWYFAAPGGEGCRAPPAITVGEVLAWMEQHLDEEVTVEQLAARRGYRWILRQRVLLAQRLLEATDETMDTIAWRAGFGTAAALRHQFTRALGTTPHAYRRTFRGPEAAA